MLAECALLWRAVPASLSDLSKRQHDLPPEETRIASSAMHSARRSIARRKRTCALGWAVRNVCSHGSSTEGVGQWSPGWCPRSSRPTRPAVEDAADDMDDHRERGPTAASSVA